MYPSTQATTPASDENNRLTESAWAAREVGDLWQANKRKAATGLKGQFRGGCFERPGLFCWYPGISLPWLHITHCCVGTDVLLQ